MNQTVLLLSASVASHSCTVVILFSNLWEQKWM